MRDNEEDVDEDKKEEESKSDGSSACLSFEGAANGSKETQ